MTNSHPLYYRRNLRHWQPPESTFFITYRLAGSLPISKIEEMKRLYLKAKIKCSYLMYDEQDQIREDYFLQFDNLLDKNLNEPHWLKEDNIATVVWDSLLFNNKKQ